MFAAAMMLLPRLNEPVDYAFAGQDKTKYISGYNLAPRALQQSLVNDYFDDAKKDCIDVNANVGEEDRTSQVMNIRDNVRDQFVTVQFCGSSAQVIFVKQASSWTPVDAVDDYPVCTAIDEYKISKKIVEHCYSTKSEELTDVLYD